MSKNNVRLSAPVCVAPVMKFAHDTCFSFDAVYGCLDNLQYSVFARSTKLESAKCLNQLRAALLLARNSLLVVARDICELPQFMPDGATFGRFKQQMFEVWSLVNSYDSRAVNMDCSMGLRVGRSKAASCKHNALASADRMCETRNELLEAIRDWTDIYRMLPCSATPPRNRSLMVVRDLSPHYQGYRLAWSILELIAVSLEHEFVAVCAHCKKTVAGTGPCGCGLRGAIKPPTERVVDFRQTRLEAADFGLEAVVVSLLAEYRQTMAIVCGWEMFERWDLLERQVDAVRKSVNTAIKACRSNDASLLTSSLAVLTSQVPELTALRMRANDIAYWELGHANQAAKIKQVKARYNVGK